jgi:POT family proton-dependent oligopeptide transporter
LVVGYVGEVYGWHYGFGLAGIGMGLGVLQYAFGLKYLSQVGNFLGDTKDNQEVMKAPLTKVEKDRVIVLLISFLLVILFWGAFEQAGGLMNIYTMENTDRFLGNWQVPASWFQSINAMFIIFFGTSVALFWANRKLKGQWLSKLSYPLSLPVSTSLYKMIVGLIIMGIGFFFMTGATAQYEATGSSAMYWLVFAYLFHTIGELCLSPVALSFVTKLAPVKYASIMMGIYFAMTGFGSKLAGLLGEWSSSLGAFTIFTGIAVTCVGIGLIVLLIRPKLEALTHGVEDEEAVVS